MAKRRKKIISNLGKVYRSKKWAVNFAKGRPGPQSRRWLEDLPQAETQKAFVVPAEYVSRIHRNKDVPRWLVSVTRNARISEALAGSRLDIE